MDKTQALHIAKQMRRGLARGYTIQKEASYQIRRFFASMEQPDQRAIEQVVEFYRAINPRGGR